MPTAITSDPRAKNVPSGWVQPIDGWLIALGAAGCSVTTMNTRADHLRRAARAFDGSPWQVTVSDLLGWVGIQTWARETRRNVYASLRSFYRWGVASGYMDVSPAENLPPVKADDPTPRPVPESVYRAAVVEAPQREQIILRLAAECGLRRAEIAQVHADDLIEDLTSWTLIVHGKGGRDREIPLPELLASDVRHCCRAGWLFPGDYAGHLSPRWVGKLATRILPGEWTLHGLRHNFASLSHSIDHDLMVLRDLLGHRSVATTQRYVRIPDEAKRRAVEAVARYRQAA